MRNPFRSALSILVAAAISAAGAAHAGVVITAGTASAGADLGGSGIWGVPPSSFSLNVFYEQANLLARPQGGTNNWHGWAGASWNVVGGANAHFSGSGTSAQGFNGAYGSSGWVYGRGHSAVEVTFTLDQAYKYNATLTGTGATGIHAGLGALGPGSHTIAGQTIGSQGGFSFDVSLTPVTPQEILGNSVFRVAQFMGPRLVVGFRPANGLSLEDAAEALGVKEFNWISTITHVPEHWSVFRRNETSGAEEPAELPILDPIDQPGWQYRIRLDSGYFQDVNNNSLVDSLPYYYNATDLESATKEGIFLFADTLAFPDVFLQSGEYVEVNTRLVGVKEDGTYISWDGLGTNFHWKSNAVYSGVGGVFGFGTYKWSDESFPMTITSGGAFDVQMDGSGAVPLPTAAWAGASLLALLTVCRACGRRHRG